MPRVSLIVPAFNTLATLPPTVESLLAQTFEDFEILVVDDGSSDQTAEWVEAHGDRRVRLVRQLNRGLAGARNGGISRASGDVIGFCDGDDLWEPEKLSSHIALLDARPDVGLSYSGSMLIGAGGEPLGLYQRPRTGEVGAAHMFMRNPVGNGSTPVLRRACLTDLTFRPAGQSRDWWFDESFRQSEDIECWMRILLTTRWQAAGIADPLTRYRIVASGLSANLDKQLNSWERVADRVAELSPEFAKKYTHKARAYQLRYLARRAVTLGDGDTALRLLCRAHAQSLHPLIHEPGKTTATWAGGLAAKVGGKPAIQKLLKGKLA